MTEMSGPRQFDLIKPPLTLDAKFFDYFDDFLSQDEAALLSETLWRELDWQQYELTLFGRRVKQPRLTAWYGDPETSYQYSGLQLDPLAWHPALLDVRDRLEQCLGYRMNSVLANAYRNGSDSMGWHSDDEHELGNRPRVASVSLGAERRFLVRRKPRGKSTAMVLGSGSLLVMKPGCQSVFHHALPKTRVESGLRINLTYRQIVG